MSERAEQRQFSTTVALGTPISRGLAFLLNCLYPPRCRFCKKCLSRQDETFCTGCHGKIRLVSHPLCKTCGRPFLDTGGEDHECGVCIARAPYFLQARAWACYPREDHEGHPLREVLQQFKYGRKVSLGKPLGRLMAKSGHAYFRNLKLDGIIPVPLHPRRLRWRGFNQSVILAREVANMWDVPIDPFVLLRSRETLPQTQLAEEERRRNVRQAFAVDSGRSVKGKSLLVLDDVYTSGATVNECSRTLLRAGAREVYVFTLARTVAA